MQLIHHTWLIFIVFIYRYTIHWAKKKKCVFTVTLGLFFSTQTTRIHILAVIMLHQQSICNVIEKESLNDWLLVKSLYFLHFLCPISDFILLCKYFGNLRKKINSFREDLSGYSKYNFSFFFSPYTQFSELSCPPTALISLEV